MSYFRAQSGAPPHSQAVSLESELVPAGSAVFVDTNVLILQWSGKSNVSSARTRIARGATLLRELAPESRISVLRSRLCKRMQISLDSFFG